MWRTSYAPKRAFQFCLADVVLSDAVLLIRCIRAAWKSAQVYFSESTLKDTNFFMLLVKVEYFFNIFLTFGRETTIHIQMQAKALLCLRIVQ